MNGNVAKWLRLTPLMKMLISLVVAFVAYLFAAGNQLNTLYLLLLLWIVFAFTYMLLSWIVLIKQNSPEKIKNNASKYDGSRPFVFTMIFIACLVSFLLVILLMTSEQTDIYSNNLVVAGTIVAIILSWSLLHTTYIFHYAHEYYGPDEEDDINKGLSFPDDDDPDYLDFAYFSLCMGTTFQVSDVEITSKKIRRIGLVHSLISFFINTIVVALSINLIAGLAN